MQNDHIKQRGAFVIFCNNIIRPRNGLSVFDFAIQLGDSVHVQEIICTCCGVWLGSVPSTIAFVLAALSFKIIIVW